MHVCIKYNLRVLFYAQLQKFNILAFDPKKHFGLRTPTFFDPKEQFLDPEPKSRKILMLTSVIFLPGCYLSFSSKKTFKSMNSRDSFSYQLCIRQHPTQGRTSNQRDGRSIEPPPIVELIVHDADENRITDFS